MGWQTWSRAERKAFVDGRDPDAWLLLYEGTTSGNGLGDELTSEEAAQWSAAFSEPLRYENVRRADLYDDAGFCAECQRRTAMNTGT